MRPLQCPGSPHKECSHQRTHRHQHPQQPAVPAAGRPHHRLPAADVAAQPGHPCASGDRRPRLCAGCAHAAVVDRRSSCTGTRPTPGALVAHRRLVPAGRRRGDHPGVPAGAVPGLISGRAQRIGP
ncbi:conserved hypothetical protein [Stenotrophomonas maltophilia K279a]|uniref:Uncharacterized protein n=1 Tax=Stenotrophomonas maltophilia (strain K279a) TaxID=522373 RepID=B2FL39_STRMK|nr:conserved hypothetical protein [Stenotrophomonas maltophilia K279a]